uniref:Chitin synthase regulator n=1 Tax=Siphoviridae sp. ctFn287 TaxID=2826215 RepID=A0A8S5LVG5_9CAUD|nr:MAG TPA: chitin synthase regulator [Siphoviridae sp. ctFn287]
MPSLWFCWVVYVFIFFALVCLLLFGRFCASCRF